MFVFCKRLKKASKLNFEKQLLCFTLSNYVPESQSHPTDRRTPRIVHVFIFVCFCQYIAQMGAYHYRTVVQYTSERR